MTIKLRTLIEIVGVLFMIWFLFGGNVWMDRVLERRIEEVRRQRRLERGTE